MYIIKIEPGEAPELFHVDNLENTTLEQLVGGPIEVVSIDPAGLYLAAYAQEADLMGDEPCCRNRYWHNNLYGMVLVTRHDEEFNFTSVHAEDLARVTGLLPVYELHGEVSGL